MTTPQASLVQLSFHGQWAELRLCRPPANALDPDTVNAMHRGLDEIEERPEVRGVMLRGAPKLFSGGLDVVALQPLGRDEMRTFWEDFGRLFVRLYRTDLVTLACLEGHAPAGGCVLALACDHRVMAEGPFRIGLNEVEVGLAVPGWLCQVYVDLLGSRRAQRALQLGSMFTAEEALQAGLVDELAPLSEVFDRSAQELNLRLARPDAARRLTKRALRGRLADEIERERQAQMDSLLDVWFSPECRSVMAALVQRLSQKRA